jgi:hypothetical protein
MVAASSPLRVLRGARADALPILDALDDVEALAGLDVEEAPCFALERFRTGSLGQPAFKIPLIGTEELDLGISLRDGFAFVVVGTKGLGVENGDKYEKPRRRRRARDLLRLERFGALRFCRLELISESVALIYVSRHGFRLRSEARVSFRSEDSVSARAATN